MRANRRMFLKVGAGTLATAATPRPAARGSEKPSDNRRLGTVYNNDGNIILNACSGKAITPDEYRAAVGHLLEGQPNLLAQTVGIPDPVLYRSQVATPRNKHLVEISSVTWLQGDESHTSASWHATQEADAWRLYLDWEPIC